MSALKPHTPPPLMTDMHTPPLALLQTCVARICAGPWMLIQLRGDPLSERLIDAGDVDLLATREAIQALTAAVYEWVRAGDCHMRLVARNRYKSALTLYSTDGKHRLDLDLWLEV